MIIEEYDNIDADFRNEYVSNLLNESDVIITNPPFSIWLPFWRWLNPADKQYLILGPKTAAGYKDVFPYFLHNNARIGYNRLKCFDSLEGITDKMEGLTRWYTNLQRGNMRSIAYKTKEQNEAAGICYKKYDNYDVLNVDRVKDIPSDYTDVMGVPLTFIEYYDPDKFELINCAAGWTWANCKSIEAELGFNPDIPTGGGLGSPIIGDKTYFTRLFIRNK